MRSLTDSVVGGSGSGCRTGAVRNGFALLFFVGGIAALGEVLGLVRIGFQVVVVGVGAHHIWCLHLLDISRGRVDRLLGVPPETMAVWITGVPLLAESWTGWLLKGQSRISGGRGKTSARCPISKHSVQSKLRGRCG